MADYDTNDLEYWDAKICEKAEEFGLSCYPQDFEICDHFQMLGYMAYSGMPSHYPHWSLGKAYEKLKTLYDYGVSGLPYEMVINADPALAYLMRDNSLALQILTIAHVYGHNDFFKNNFTFKSTRAEFVLATFKVHADRVRSYIEDPSVGLEKVEAVLDAAHALSFSCRRNSAIRKLSRKEQEEQILEAAKAPVDIFGRIHKRPEYVEPDLHKVPLQPEEDILLFIRDYNPRLSEWEKDLLTIAHEGAQYFIPQVETKIMNEGWASYWHREILNSLGLPEHLHLEFLVRHSQVVRPFPRGLNPYHLGLRIWDKLYLQYGGTPRTPEEESLIARMEAEDDYTKPHDIPEFSSAHEKLFAVRMADRDVSFLRQHLTEFMMRDLDMFQYEPLGEDLVVTKVSDRASWREVKETLLKNIGMESTPVITIEDADHGGNRILFCKHNHDGRDLQLEYAEKTLAYLFKLWGHEVVLQTTFGNKHASLMYGDRGFSTKPVK
jgi:stage V sporulation protein R